MLWKIAVACLMVALLGGAQADGDFTSAELVAKMEKKTCPLALNRKAQKFCPCGHTGDTQRCAGGLKCNPINPPLPPPKPGKPPVYGICTPLKCMKSPKMAGCQCGGKLGACSPGLTCYRKPTKKNSKDMLTIVGFCCDETTPFAALGCHCGGIMNPKPCMPGLQCKLNGMNPDFGGTCRKG